MAGEADKHQVVTEILKEAAERLDRDHSEIERTLADSKAALRMMHYAASELSNEASVATDADAEAQRR